MNVDYINLIIRVLILFFTAMSSEIAMGKKLYSISLLLFAVWVTIFRLTLFRAVTAYIGVFQHESNSFVVGTAATLSGSQFANFTDFILLVAIILLFIDIIKFKRNISAGERL